MACLVREAQAGQLHALNSLAAVPNLGEHGWNGKACHMSLSRWIGRIGKGNARECDCKSKNQEMQIIFLP